MARTGISLVLALIVTFALLFVMQLLIETGKASITDTVSGRLVDFVRVKREEVTERKKVKPKKPITPEQPPPDMPQPQMDSADMSGADVVGISSPSMSADLNISGNFGFSVADGEYLPIVKVAPVYPRRAQERGIEGYVVLEFIVTKAGTVMNPVVIEADPPNIFDRAAIQAALKFKYKPRVVDGEPIDVPGVRNIIRFEIAEG